MNINSPHTPVRCAASLVADLRTRTASLAEVQEFVLSRAGL